MNSTIKQQAEQVSRAFQFFKGTSGDIYKPTREEIEIIGNAADTLYALNNIDFTSIISILEVTPPNDRGKVEQWYRAIETLKAIRAEK